MNHDDKFQVAALDIGTDLQKEGHALLERVDVRNQSVHLVPTGTLSATEQDVVESVAEDAIEGLPFAVSEWWPARNGETHLVVSPYWPTGGQLSREQLAEYDEFIESFESDDSTCDSGTRPEEEAEA